jgi:hypothetical protein
LLQNPLKGKIPASESPAIIIVQKVTGILCLKPPISKTL